MGEVKLTEEQQAIVNHDDGAARVFAVAGAGKTTAMVHRIHRLVEAGIFAPERILASSFSKETVTSLGKNLNQWSVCRTVRTQTLHSLGYQIIRKAWDRGYLEKPKSVLEPDKVAFQLYTQAIREARQQNLSYKDELENLDQEDFLNYVSQCKGKLQYADLSRICFPADGPHRNIAQPAKPPLAAELGWYLDLYRLFETIRDRQGWIGFDDMLMTGWQLLVHHPDLLAYFQSQFDCILIDEFQDVNRAQFGILDLLIRPHHNYMVIGDDDQTIYEWRGAEVQFILKAFDRYNPINYKITDNFRCKASQVALANAVIRHNQNRHPKQLSLTQGFDGCTQIHQQANSEQLGKSIVNQVKKALDQGMAPTEIAILVRVYAQTPYIEQHLIKDNIPYWGADLVPFYRRSEILNFLAFAHLAQLETLLEKEQGMTAEILQEWQEVWNRAKLIPPLRYLSKDLKEQIQETVVAGQASLSQVLTSLQTAILQERTAQTLSILAKWLTIAPRQDSGQEALEQLDACIRYREYLERHSGFKATGHAKAAGIDAMIYYAADKGNLSSFLHHLEQLQQQAAQHTQNSNQCIRLTTIHQSKGLEWKLVIVPHCNNGFIPFGENLSQAELEEERRLMYVAMTRSKQELHLHVLKQQPTSQFLYEAQAEAILKKTAQLQQALQQESSTWQASDVVNFLKLVKALRVERYFRQWWNGEPQRKTAIASTIQQFLMAAQQQQALKSLGLENHPLEIWQAIAPAQQAPTVDFPGLAALVEATQSRPSGPNLFGKLRSGDRVKHGKFGQGVVVEVERQKQDTKEIITVDFVTNGKKRLLITTEVCSLQLIRR